MGMFDNDEVKEFDADVSISDADLESAVKLIARLMELESISAKIAGKMAEIQGNIRKLSEELIPDSFFEMGITSLEVAGKKVTVKPFYGASIPEERKEDAYGWLRENDFGDIIKNIFEINIGRDTEQALEIAKMLEKNNVGYNKKESVHASTLKAFVKTQIENGLVLPESINVYTGKKTVIK